jgi:hypothetical protein
MLASSSGLWNRVGSRSAEVLSQLAAMNLNDEERGAVVDIVHSGQAIKKAAAILDDDRNLRPYLESLRKTAESSSIGTREQRDALLADW